MSESVTKDSIQIARLEEQFSAMRHSMADMAETMEVMRDELGAVKSQLEQAKGGWRTLVWFGGTAATLGGFVSWAVAHVRIQ